MMIQDPHITDPEIEMYLLYRLSENLISKEGNIFQYSEIGDLKLKTYSSQICAIYTFSYIYANGGQVSFIKTKRKRTKKDPITGKYIRIPSKDYTQEDILALLLNKGDYNEKSLSVHDLSIVSGKMEIIESIQKDIFKMLDDFMAGKKIHNMEYSIARKIVYKRLIAHIEIKEYNNLEDESNICFSFRKKSFSNYKEFPLLHTFLIFGKLGYIDIDVDTSYGYYDYGDEIACHVKILPIFEEIAKKHFTLENIILDVILDQKYRECRLTTKKGDILIDRTSEHNAEDTKFIDLQKKYPHSEIKARNYNGKITKYEVKEKIRLNKDEQE